MSDYLISQLAKAVSEHGVAGGNMTEKLASLAEKHDLSALEIGRVAADANRATQLALYKVAEDKRFKFDLCDAASVTKTAQKIAVHSLFDNTDARKMASVTVEEGGDPFAAPRFDEPVKMSLYEAPVDPRQAARDQVVELDRLIAKLSRQEAEVLAVKEAACSEATKWWGDTHDALRRAIQSAADLCQTGIAFHDLYFAMRSAVNGQGATDDDRRVTDMLALHILGELKKRGLPNQALRVAFRGDPRQLESLDEGDILALVKLSLGIPSDAAEDTDILNPARKQARLYVEHVSAMAAPRPDSDRGFDLGTEAAEWLTKSPIQQENAVPEAWVRAAEPLLNGKPRVINANSEFVTAIKDLVNSQQRLGKNHNAQEYLGLKLKDIADALTQAREARSKLANIGGLITGAAGAILGGAQALGGIKQVVDNIRPAPKPKEAPKAQEATAPATV
jgi:hypothetical protein